LRTEKEAAVLSMITAHHLVVVVISNKATPLLEVKTLRTEKEAPVLSMITAHHLVVVVISNTATPLLEVIREVPHEDVGMDMIGMDVIGVNVIVKTPLQ
jgi:hypothetical protein